MIRLRIGWNAIKKMIVYYCLNCFREDGENYTLTVI